jgi:radical SAM superfamily enzyme YgiQ (UPF0313 family)
MPSTMPIKVVSPSERARTVTPAGRGQLKAVLVNPYELGRQPFALASLAACLKRDGVDVRCVDLSLQKLDAETFAGAGMVGLYVGMHTATRIAVEAIPRIRSLAPDARVAVFGLYAPMNAGLFAGMGASVIVGGEFEPRLAAFARRLRDGEAPEPATCANIDLAKVDFLVPDRSDLPPLASYAHLALPDGGQRTVAFAEASRGCKHLCRHCPVVPVYRGRFRVVPQKVVLADVRQQVAAGATHVSFGDPDFLNGPTHALRITRALAAEFPGITYDFTAKVQHLIEHAALLPEFHRTGCLFITSAVESVDDEVLALLDKNHAGRDFDRVAALLRSAGIGFAPTFVAFTPWTTLEGYIALLQRLVDLDLVLNVPPVQLSIRLLVPEGSYLLELPGFRDLLQPFDSRMLGYPWRNPDPRADDLQRAVQGVVERGAAQDRPREAVFGEIWKLAHEAAGLPVPGLPQGASGVPIPQMSEPWYCCAEPTSQQLMSF